MRDKLLFYGYVSHFGLVEVYIFHIDGFNMTVCNPQYDQGGLLHLITAKCFTTTQ